MTSTNIVVVGAGPYGLSLAAHLTALGLERRVFGSRLAAWKNHMPEGMVLKSEPYATDLSAPVPGYTAGDHARVVGASYRSRVTPLTKERFIEYAEWFADRLVPDVEDTQVVSIHRCDDGFELVTDTGERLSARHVVVATGIVPFAHVAAPLGELGDCVSHSSAHRDLSPFRGADVAVIGGGQSAAETAALLHEVGARPRLVVRGPGIYWPAANPAHPRLRSRLKRPPARLCEGWRCVGYTTLPDLFRLFPEQKRITDARSFLGPAGAWWLRSRVEGVVPMHVGTEVVSATRSGARVRLGLFGPGPSSLECDHVIAATGYQYDVNRLSYLDLGLRRALRVAGGAPVLSRSFESSVPGLHFMGALSSPSMGPSMRFIAGTHFAARRVAQTLATSDGASGLAHRAG